MSQGTTGGGGKRPTAVITGGLGYIGQSLAFALKSAGEPVLVIDRRAIPGQVPGIGVITGSIADPAVWRQVADESQPTAIYHCAGLISVTESLARPAEYFRENVAAGIAMLDHMLSLIGPVPVVFSSSAAVYGAPERLPLREDAALRPMSPYGVTKRQFEEVLAAYAAPYGIPWVALRYFNAAGMVGPVREQHDPETHLLPRVADAVRAGGAPVIYGSDYPTADGTAVRDYIHVADLAEAHQAAARYLRQGGESGPINLGSGQGTSVTQVLEAFAAVSGAVLRPQRQPRRAGDPPELVADIGRARTVLRWAPRRSGIREIVAEVWQGRMTRRAAQ
ncbi:MAG: UDP-glucose 4-epimerase GalE [Thermaerobacter sp.]|nr:UDP-glucose 4-epimerase GalE [Thermaerobacter sp.]